MAKKSGDLKEYRAKRDPSRTPEPTGSEVPRPRAGGIPRFVVQKHAARRLHWDLRLEVDGVLWSWAVPNGPSRDPSEKRLAVHTEDHPIEYLDFEDVIPAGNYGAGAMIVWDQGTYVPLHPMREGLESGKLLFELRGHKLRGAWTLVKLRKSDEEDAWLLIKERDAMAAAGPDSFPEDSIFSGLTVEELGAGTDPEERVRAELRRVRAPRRLFAPDEVRPMLAETAESPFSRAGWIFEFKYDGYRTLAFREDDDVRLISRRGNDLSPAFPELTRAIARLPYRRFLLDGEIVVEDDAGIPSFQRLQQRAQLRRAIDIRRGELTLPAKLWIFDLLAFDDRDLRPVPLRERKAILRELLPSAGTIRYSDHIEEYGEALFEQAVRVGLEGVIGKKADGPYRTGRSAEWLKVRAHRTDDFVVVGWSAPKGGRSGFGALYLAQHAGGSLVFCGQVGSGFSDRQLREIHARLEAARIPEPPCVGAPVRKGDGWTRPEIVCEVRFFERTDDGLLRQPVFLRLRDDKAPGDCLASADFEPLPAATLNAVDEATESAADLVTNDGETEADAPPADDAPAAARRRSPRSRKTADAAASSRNGGARDRAVHFTNLDKVFWPEDGYTKGDLIAYYRAVAPWILPFLRDRPVVLTRYPDGITGKSFFQKDAPSFVPSWIRTVQVPDDSDDGRTPSYFICDDEETLLYLANSASIPLHVWPSRVASIERPDWCILDLDPKEAPFEHVVELAVAARELCDEIGLPVHAKTSGSSGIHLLVPLGGQLDHELTKVLGELLARVLVRRLPEIATITRQVGRRGGKVYVDYLQNGRGKLLVSPYCVRPLPGAPVSTPLQWSEIEPGLDIRRFTIRSVPPRLRKMRDDPLLPVLSQTPDLLAALDALQGRL